MSRPCIIGLTGQTGAGKSAASAQLLKEGFFIIDCDRVARQVVKPGTDGLKAIAAVFSDDILFPDGSLNRKALGKCVFSDRAALQTLNETIFPFIRIEVHRLIEQAARDGRDAVILDAPTLFESGMNDECALILGVCADAKLRKARIMARDQIGEAAAQARMNSQYPEAFFRAHCQIIIENNGTEEQFVRNVQNAANQIKEWIHGCSHS